MAYASLSVLELEDSGRSGPLQLNGGVGGALGGCDRGDVWDGGSGWDPSVRGILKRAVFEFVISSRYLTQFRAERYGTI